MQRIRLNCKQLYSCAKKTAFVFLFALLGVYATAQTPVSGTFTINSALATAGSNFQTFTEAIFSLGYGINGAVVFNVTPGSGPYNEQINISSIAGSSASNTVTFNCNGVTIQNASTNSFSRAVVKLDGVKHIIIDSLKVLPIVVDDPLSYGWGFSLLRDADSNIIRKSTVTIPIYNTSNVQNLIGIYVGSSDDYPNSNGLSNCDYNILDRNTIIGGYWGIVLDSYAGNFGTSYTPMNGNQVTNNKLTSFGTYGIYGIWNNGTVISGNDLNGGIVGNSQGITLDEMNTNVKIIGNRVHNIGSAVSTATQSFIAIKVANSKADSDKKNIIANNAVYDIKNTGSQTGIDIGGSSYVDVLHNTVVLDTLGAASSTTTNGYYHESGNANINFLNNIISVQRTGSGSKYGINVAAVGSGFVCDYNDIIVAASNTFGRLVSTNYATLATWQTASGFDSHSASQDPIFAGLATGNLKPTNAAMDNLGIFAGISTDINGDIRNNINPDAGAYEFLTPACSAPVTGGSTIATPLNAICTSNLVTLNIAGNSFGSGQTYQWQTSSTLAGTYTSISGNLIVPVYDIHPTANLYYRAVITCGAVTANTVPLLVAITQPLSGNGYTINSASPTTATNFQKFADLLKALKCGIGGPVVVNVAPNSGPYNEQIIIPEIAGMSATNTLTINGNGATLTYLATVAEERATLKLNGADYVTIDSINITAQGSASGQYGYGVQLLNNADHNVISRCTITVNKTSTSSNFVGIAISSSATDAIGSSASYCDSNKITRNNIIGGYYGITLYSDPSVGKVFYDTISNNTFTDMHAYGIYVYGTDHTLVEGNDISRPTRTVTNSTFYGIYLNNINTSLSVSKNKIHNTFDAIPVTTNAASNAIYLNNCDATASTANTVSNNIVYNFGGIGALVGLYNASSDYILCYHNTIVFDGTAGTPTTTARAIYQTTAAAGLEYKNNNIFITRNGTGTNHGIYMNTASTTYASDNNNFYITGSGTNKTGYVNSVSYTALSDWQTGSSKDALSLSVNPTFTSAATGNLKPTQSTLNNKGIFVGITTDITGAARSATLPDIGAYEFDVVVPIQLLNINAAKSNSDVVVKWATITEINSKEFAVERSVDGTNFSSVGTVAAKGNSNGQQTYQFVDNNAVTAATTNILYYRLKLIDKNGAFNYSSIVTVHLSKGSEIIKVFPNPFVSQLFASIVTENAGSVSIEISDMAGRLIGKQSQQVNIGTTNININGVAKLQAGTYLITVYVDGNKQVFKVTK